MYSYIFIFSFFTTVLKPKWLKIGLNWSRERQPFRL